MTHKSVYVKEKFKVTKQWGDVWHQHWYIVAKNTKAESREDDEGITREGKIRNKVIINKYKREARKRKTFSISGPCVQDVRLEII